ncbi:hypothetical protein ACFWIB_04335 [Streptomyces sp. NPDC127051]|uniref:hypothetical protein n=1 Tax=Streptomyces sp. NPDC127051 TaxID=3347119 RepID=UPI003659CFFC
MTPRHTTHVTTTPELIAAIVANYSCGHCSSETKPWTDRHGQLHINVHHDDGCPVLEGALSAVPDAFRAARSVTA